MKLPQTHLPLLWFYLSKTAISLLTRESLSEKRKRLLNIWEQRFFFTSVGRSYFDEDWYVRNYSEHIDKSIAPLIHFIFFGISKRFNPNPYFDTEWYCKTYPEVINNQYYPYLHYIKYGANELKSPHPLFDINWYLNTYNDVVEIKMEPLLHFLRYGGIEGRNPNPYFDSTWYTKKYPETKISKQLPLEHYLSIGQKKGYSPHPYFDTQWYLSENPDVKQFKQSALHHYIEMGVKEDRDPNPYFDTQWYKNEYPDVAKSNLSPLLHYTEIGSREYRQPSEFFHTEWYLKENPDVPHHGMEALYHYLHFGEDEGRRTFPEPCIPAHNKGRGGSPSPYPINANLSYQNDIVFNFDVVIVTYNSSKWIDGCLRTLLCHDSDLSISIVDNGSADDTILKLNEWKSKFTNFTIHQNKTNIGFGAANNIGAQFYSGEHILFINIDTELDNPDVLKHLSCAILRSKNNVAAWELRQLPYEHPKCYDPVSLETGWCSGAAVVIKRDAFLEIGGFDEKLFMYCEDVDISWRLRGKGYRLLYVPSATITHHSYSEPGEIKPIAQLFGVKHNYFLRNRFGSDHDRRVGKSLLLKFEQYARKNLPSNAFDKLLNTEEESLLFRQSKSEPSQDFLPSFDKFEYDLAREGAFYKSALSTQTATVSIIIRTIGHLHYLENAIYSVLNQTYKNIELIIIEDGSSKAKDLISKIRGYNIVYKSVPKMGRCKAGNVGLETASGEYINFLDEDDLLFSDHVETLINALSVRTDFGAVWASAFSVQTEMDKDNQIYFDRQYTLGHTIEPTHETILLYNHFPIQSALFRRECYESLGGFDSDIQLLEDWDLWIRYLKKYNFFRIAKTTSLYRIPFENNQYAERKQSLQLFYDRVRDKHL